MSSTYAFKFPLTWHVIAPLPSPTDEEPTCHNQTTASSAPPKTSRTDLSRSALILAVATASGKSSNAQSTTNTTTLQNGAHKFYFLATTVTCYLHSFRRHMRRRRRSTDVRLTSVSTAPISLSCRKTRMRTPADAATPFLEDALRRRLRYSQQTLQSKSSSSAQAARKGRVSHAVNSLRQTTSAQQGLQHHAAPPSTACSVANTTRSAQAASVARGSSSATAAMQ